MAPYPSAILWHTGIGYVRMWMRVSASTLLLLALASCLVPSTGLAQSQLGMTELARVKSLLELYRAELSGEQFSLLSSKLAQTEQAYVELTTMTEASGEAAAVAAESGAAAEVATTGGRALLSGVAELLPLLVFAWPSTAHAPGVKEEKPEVRAARAKVAERLQALAQAVRQVESERKATSPRASQRPRAGRKKPLSLSDDTTCFWVGVGGGGRPVICRYNCEGVDDTIEILLPDSSYRCPGEASNPLKWGQIKRFPQRW